MIAGCGTDVGKTVVAAILTNLLKADYWKPIQCGMEDSSDTFMMGQWTDECINTIHHPAYSLKAPLSPHHAARLENISIRTGSIILPKTERTLVIEGVGGIFVPLKTSFLCVDLFQTWSCNWIIVSRNYLGSINHTLLTIEALRQRQIPLAGIIFNGEPNPDSENAILEYSKLSCLGRLLPEPCINLKTIQKYVELWKMPFSKIFP